MPEYDYKFKIWLKDDSVEPWPTSWRLWHEAYFIQINDVLGGQGGYTNLLETGCTTENWTTPDCIRTCGSDTTLFSSPENVWNCATLAAVAMDSVQGKKTADPKSVREMDKIFGLGGSLEAFDKLHVFNMMRPCFWQSCSDSKYGTCTREIRDFQNDHNITSENLEKFSQAISESYCHSAVLSIDSDIAGPGILVAYMVQIALVAIVACFFWATHPPVRDRARNLADEGLRLLGRTPRNSVPRATGSEPAGRFALAVHSTVTQLHEAQTAFGITIGIIFLCAFGGQSKFGLANVSSVLSFFLNHDIAFGLLAVGTSPIVFLQPCRQRVGKHDKSRILSLVPMVMAWILMILAHGFKTHGLWDDPKKFHGNLKANAPIDDCGGNPGPMSYCLRHGSRPAPDVFRLTIALVPTLHTLFFLVIVDEILFWVRKKHVGDKMLRLGKVLSKTISYFMVLAKLPSYGMLIVCFIEVVQAYLKIEELNGGQYAWGFGQLVAMAIWIPTIADFFIYLIVGTKKGTESRIHEQLEVNQVGPKTVPSQDNVDDGIDNQHVPLLATRVSMKSVPDIENNDAVSALDITRP